MATCELITIVGAGDVVAKRLLPAVVASQFATRIHVIHDGICDIQAADDPLIAVTDLRSRGTEATDWVKDYFRANTQPVIVATPPAARPFYIGATLSGRGLAIAEKPLYTDAAQRAAFPTSPKDLRRLFALSYYTQEKAIGWSWLYRPEPSLERIILFEDQASSERVRTLFTALGALESVELAICEGAAHPSPMERRFWFERLPEGVWFDMGVHILSMLFTASGNVRVDAAYGSRDLRRFRLVGSIGRASFNAEFGKGFPGDVERRFLVAHYSHGRVVCDVDTYRCTVEHNRLGKATIDAYFGNFRYRTIVEQVRLFVLDNGWPASGERLDMLAAQQSALELLMDWWPKITSS